ncbi:MULTISPECIES: hypothetical protein [Limnochorda]|uniref:hypothetical protein n=1 Tax=Limnochorda TaxID=1676651 RepID=UPI001849319E|nr:hypothetical protein [Limnochorda pilosa]MBO2485815.1 hypothetical protein [Bacillota bacterium]MBO2519247.1 hypothetical protein [Bacillota bacterium]NMA72283.1 hypothetical protein [Bacillota bacterium]
MERAFRVVAAGLIAMFILLAWAIVAIPGSLLVKLILFFVLTASAFGITLVMTTESPVADAVLRPPWADEAAGGPAPSDDDGAGAPAAKPVRARARRAAEEGGDGEPVGAPAAGRAQGDEAPGS